jgi:phosphoglycolate phosphatase
MTELIEGLEARRIPWGIVTNKPSWLTETLLRDLGLTGRAACIVSGDTTPHSTPHPGPILHACRLLRCDPGCYAERDMAAGRAAGTRTPVALFGYLGTADRPQAWGADGLIDHTLDLLGWIDA